MLQAMTPLDFNVVVPGGVQAEKVGISTLNDILTDLVESVYGSRIAIDFSDGELKGLYTPPSPTGRVDEKPGLGKATLAGKMRQECGRVVLDGSWEHTDGPLSQGRFMMVQKQFHPDFSRCIKTDDCLRLVSAVSGKCLKAVGVLMNSEALGMPPSVVPIIQRFNGKPVLVKQSIMGTSASAIDLIRYFRHSSSISISYGRGRE